jgi:hypothetical protein
MITIQTLSILKVNVLEKAHFAFVRMVDSNAPSLLTIGSTDSEIAPVSCKNEGLG